MRQPRADQRFEASAEESQVATAGRPSADRHGSARRCGGSGGRPDLGRGVPRAAPAGAGGCTAVVRETSSRRRRGRRPRLQAYRPTGLSPGRLRAVSGLPPGRLRAVSGPYEVTQRQPTTRHCAGRHDRSGQFARWSTCPWTSRSPHGTATSRLPPVRSGSESRTRTDKINDRSGG